MTVTYKVYRDGSHVASPTGTSFTDTGLANGTTYSYQVSAVRDGLEGPKSAVVTATPNVQTGLARPFAAPVTTATYTVPSNITHDGSSSAASALNSWIATVPDGSIIDFAIAGATYRLDAALDFNNRHNLVVRGNGSTTFTMHTTASDYWQSTFVVRAGTSHMAFEGFTVTGENNDWSLSNEHVHVLASVGWYGNAPTSYVEMSNVTASHIYGDGVYIEGRNDTAAPSSHYWIHDCHFDWIGRNVISLINVHHVWFEQNTAGDVGGAMFDLEPNQATETIDSVWYRNNTLGAPSHETSGIFGWFVSDAQIGTGVGCIISNINVTDNTVAGNSANGYDGTPRSLNSRFSGASSGHHSNIVFTGNSTPMSVHGGAGVIYASYVDGLTVTGNTIPVLDGAKVGTSNCTSAVTSPNA